MVEVGVWRGKSLAYLASAGAKKNLQVVGYDRFDPDYYLRAPIPGLTSPQWLELVKSDMVRLLPAAPPTVIQTDSVTAAGLHAAGSVFFVFLDGGHAEEQVLADIAAWLPKIAAGGIMAGHDLSRTNCPGVMAALIRSGLDWSSTSKDSWIARIPP